MVSGRHYPDSHDCHDCSRCLRRYFHCDCLAPPASNVGVVFFSCRPFSHHSHGADGSNDGKPTAASSGECPYLRVVFVWNPSRSCQIAVFLLSVRCCCCSCCVRRKRMSQYQFCTPKLVLLGPEFSFGPLVHAHIAQRAHTLRMEPIEAGVTPNIKS